MDAGRAFNTYPLMAGRWVPEDYWDASLPGLRSLFENTAAVQWDHRMLAATTAVSALALWSWVRASAAPATAKRCMDLVAGVTAAQFALGVWTLLEYVPVPLGSAHQANALNLFTAVLLTLHTLRPSVPGALSVAIARVSAPVTAAAVAAVGVAVTTHR
uniref:Cytochrome oxidase assembly protein n=1 Tax=Chlamydomonas euryale TaxID=1486919 RepID=A0A7R9V020_9CHLO